MVAPVTLRVVIVDDSVLFQQAVIACLQPLRFTTLCGVAGSVAAGLSLVAEQRPAVVLMDLALPDGDGISATRRIRDHAPGTTVVMITIQDDEATRREALAAGARAFVSKARIGLELGPLLEGFHRDEETRKHARTGASEG